MKHKIIACFLSLILIFSCVSVSSFVMAEDTLEYSDDFIFATTLGIVPEDLVPGDVITRIELAKVFTNVILNGVENGKTGSSQYFSDVTPDNAMYADTVASTGIMGGVGDGMFAPDAPVTKSQFAKAMVTFLGYGEKAIGMGGYPGGYMAVATLLDVTDAGGSGDSLVTVDLVAAMFKRAVNVPILEMVKFGQSYGYVEREDMDYLSTYMGIYRYRDVINANYMTNVLNGGEFFYNEIMVGETKITFDPEVFSISDFLGYRADFYYKDNTGAKELVFFENAGNNVKVLTEEEIDSYRNGELIYYEGMKERKITLSKDVNIIYNGTLLERYDASIFTSWKNTYMDGKITAIDNNNDKKFDFIIIDAYDTYVVKSIMDDMIFTTYRAGDVIDLGDYVDGRDIIFRNIYGKPVLLSYIEEGSVLSVSRDKDGKIKNITVTIDTMSGELEFYEVDNGKYYFKVNGVVCEPSNALALNPQLDNVEIGARIKVMFNKDGLVSDIETLKYQSDNLGYIVKSHIGKNTIEGQKVSLRIFTKNSEFESYKLSEKSTVFYGPEKFSGIKPMDVLEYLGTTDGGEVVRQPVYYKVNENGEIYHIEICNPLSGPFDGFHKLSTGVEGVQTEYRSSSAGFAGKLLVNATTVFAVPSEEFRDVDEHYSIPKLYGGEKYTVESAWAKEKGTRVASVIVLGNSQNAGAVYSGDTVMVISKISNIIDQDGDVSVRVEGYVGKTLSVYLAKKGTMNIGPGGTMAEKGDIIRFNLDGEKKIISPEIIFDESGRNMPNFASNPSASSFMARPRYAHGNIIWADKGSMTLNIVDSTAGTSTEESYLKTTSLNMIKVKNVNKKTMTVTVATPEDFYALPSGSVDNRQVFLYTRSGDPNLIVLYD